MKRLGLTVIASGVALMAAAPVLAAPTVTRCDSGTINSANGCNIVFDGTSGNYGNPNVASSPFTDIYRFDLASDGMLGLTLQSIGMSPNSDISFSVARLNPPGAGGNVPLVEGSTGPIEFYSLSNIAAVAGTYSIRLQGSVAGAMPNAAYSGTISFAPAAAVPEAATWAMMILGCGMMGAALRRARRSGARQTVFG